MAISLHCENENYLKSRISTEKKVVTLILGGPTRYYDYNNQVIDSLFSKIEHNFLKNNYRFPPSRFQKQYNSVNRVSEISIIVIKERF